VGPGVVDQAVEVVGVHGVVLHVGEVIVEVFAELSSALLHAHQDAHGLFEVAGILDRDSCEFVLVEYESQPLVDLLSPGGEALSDRPPGLSVLLEGFSDGIGPLVLSPGSVGVEYVGVGLLAPEPIPGNGNNNSGVPLVVREGIIFRGGKGSLDSFGKTGIDINGGVGHDHFGGGEVLFVEALAVLVHDGGGEVDFGFVDVIVAHGVRIALVVAG